MKYTTSVHKRVMHDAQYATYRENKNQSSSFIDSTLPLSVCSPTQLSFTQTWFFFTPVLYALSCTECSFC